MKMRNKMAVLALAVAGIIGGVGLYSSTAYSRVCFLVGGCRTRDGKLEKFLNSRGESVVSTGVDINPTVIDQDCGSLGFVKCKKPELSSMKCMKNGEIWTEKCMCNENDEFPYTYGTDMSADRVGTPCCNPPCPKKTMSPQWNLQTPYTGGENPGCNQTNTSEICVDSQGYHFKHKICKAGFGYVLTETNALVSGIHNPVTVCQSPNAIGTDLSCVEVNHLAEGASPVTRYSGCECPVEYQYMMSDIPSDAFTIDTVTAAQNKEYCFKNIQHENIDNINLYKASARKCSGKAEAGGFWKSDYDSSTEYYDPEEDETWDGLTCHLVKPKCDKTVYRYLAGDDMAYSESLPNYMPGRDRQVPEWVGIEHAKKYVGVGGMCVDNEGKHFQYKICKSRYKYMPDPGDEETEQRIYSAFGGTPYYFPELCSPMAMDIENDDYCEEISLSSSAPQTKKYTTCNCPDEYQYDLGGALPRSHGASFCRVGDEYRYTTDYATCSETSESIEEYTVLHAGRTGTWWDTCNRGRWGTHYAVESISFGGETCSLCAPYCDTSVYKYTSSDADAKHRVVQSSSVMCEDPDGVHSKYRVCKTDYTYMRTTGDSATDNAIINKLRGFGSGPITVCDGSFTGSDDYCDSEVDGVEVRMYKSCTCGSQYQYDLGELPKSHSASFCRIGSEYKYEYDYAQGCSGLSEPLSNYTGAHGGRTATWWDTCNRGRYGTHYAVESETFGGEICSLCAPYCDTSVYKYANGDTNGGMYQLISHKEVCEDPNGLHRKYRACNSQYKYLLNPSRYTADTVAALQTINKEVEVCESNYTGTAEYCVQEIPGGGEVNLYKGCGCNEYVYPLTAQEIADNEAFVSAGTCTDYNNQVRHKPACAGQISHGRAWREQCLMGEFTAYGHPDATAGNLVCHECFEAM